MPTTLEELLEKSKGCFNYNSYTPSGWKLIAKYLSKKYGFNGAYAVLDSKHMRWCADRNDRPSTFKNFIEYMQDHIDDAEVTYLLESYSNAENN